MKQNETKLNRKLQLAVGSHRQSNDLQLCANLFASSPRCRLHLPRTRPLLVSAAPSRRTRAHHNSERDSCPRQRHLNVATLSAPRWPRRPRNILMTLRFVWHYPQLPEPPRSALARPASPDWSQFSHSPPI